MIRGLLKSISEENYNKIDFILNLRNGCLNKSDNQDHEIK